MKLGKPLWIAGALCLPCCVTPILALLSAFGISAAWMSEAKVLAAVIAAISVVFAVGWWRRRLRVTENRVCDVDCGCKAGKAC